MRRGTRHVARGTETGQRPRPGSRARPLGREVLAGFSHSTRPGDVTVLQVPFDCQVDDLMVAIALVAEQYRCASESEAWAEVDGERWR